MDLCLKNGSVDANMFIEKNLQAVSDDIKNNPKFEMALTSAIMELTETNKLSGYYPPIKLIVANDGRRFILRGGIRPSPYVGNPDLKDNRCFQQVDFKVDKNNNLEVISSYGVFYRYRDYIRNANMGPRDKDLFNPSYERDTPTIISTYHTHETYLPEGIQVEKSSYSDTYPLSCDFRDDQQLMEQTMIHSPSQWFYNITPDHAQWEYVPFATNVHRFKDELAIVHASKRDGRRGNVVSEDFVSMTEYPDMLSTVPTAYKRFKDGKIVVTDEYQKYYPDMKPFDLDREMHKIFLKGIRTSKTWEISERRPVAKKMQEMVRESLINRYGVPEEELEEENENERRI